MSTVTMPLHRLIRKMVGTFDDLGRDAMARVDARLWADHYRKKAARLGIKFQKPA